MTRSIPTAVSPHKINELNEAEEPAKELLRRLGYTYVPRDILAQERDNEREVLLKGRLQRALLRLNPWMTDDQAERVIFNLEHVDAVGMARNQVIHEYLTYGMPLEVDEPGGRRTRNVVFFDFDHPDARDGRNEFVVTTQMRVRRGSERGLEKVEDDEKVVKPDIVLFVNGIPLVVIEAKSPTLLDIWKTRAVRQLRRYQEAGPEWHGCGAPELFDYNLLCVGLCGAAAVYAPVGARENEFVAWKSVAPYSEQEVQERFGVESKGQAQPIVGLLSPAALLDILRDFVIYEPEKGRLVKKLPRYQQYRAVNEAMARLLTRAKPEERGGVVWHTQGSGKSLTMLWLATKLRREPRLENPTIAIVTDRTQLDRQITETFKRCGFPAPQHAASTAELRELLTIGSGRTIMTTIQKFEEALTIPEGQLQTLNDADNVFVMVDEAHRTQYGLLGAKMSKALPNATFIGFTGTPIDKGFRRSTMRRFGPLIDKYTIPQSVEDGATVPIYYEARLPELTILGPNTLDRLFDTLFKDEPEEVRRRIRRRYANKDTLAVADKRIEMIALDIAEHYDKHIRRNGFKAQAVAPSRDAAMRYAEKLRDFGVSAFPIITTTNDDGPEFKWAREIDQDQVIAAFKDPDGEPEMLVVVDMLLTGFDAPIEQVLYLDRGLREHTLLQAIARVNRRCTLVRNGVTTEKTYGLVVDYSGVSQDLESALADYFDPRDLQGTWSEFEEDPSASIDSAAIRAESYFKGLSLDDTWVCVNVFAADEDTEGDFKADLFERFEADYRDFAWLMDRFLPNAAALGYVDRLTRLTRIRAYVRAQFLRINADIDWSGVSAKIKDLINARVDAEVKELMKPVSILDSEFDSRIGALPHDEARASVMEHAIRAQIKERIDENPAFYERLSEQLEKIIAQMRQRVIDAAEACRRLARLRSEVMSEAQVATQQGMSEVSFAVYELLEQSTGRRPTGGRPTQVREAPQPYRLQVDEDLKDIAIRLEGIMKQGQSIIDWQDREDVQRMMRRDIKRELRKVDGLSEERIEELARTMIEIARRKLAR
jgi:type I restriction enzyme R subunit